MFWEHLGVHKFGSRRPSKFDCYKPVVSVGGNVRTSCGSRGNIRPSRHAPSSALEVMMQTWVLYAMVTFTVRSKELNDTETEEVVREAGSLRSKGDTSRALQMYETAAGFGSGRWKRESAFELGVLLERGGDFGGAMKWLQIAASLGHPGAQLSMAVAVGSAAYVEHDFASGRWQNASKEDVAVLHEYFAALGDEPLAMMALGFRHLYGVGVPVKCEAAVEYYAAAADAAVMASSHVFAPNERVRLSEADADNAVIGKLLARWPKRTRKQKQILRYHKHEAAKGDTLSQVSLARAYYLGNEGVNQDFVRARKYFKLAADKEDPVASSWLGYMMLLGLGGDAKPGEARELLRRGEAKGNDVALNGVGLYKLMIEKDAKAAQTYFTKASERHADALYNLAMSHLDWDGHASSEEAIFADKLRLATSDNVKITLKHQAAAKLQRALSYLEVAAKAGHIRALHKVGRLYVAGFVRSPKCEAAASWLKTVAERGPWEKQLAEAYYKFEAGDSVGARLLYAKLAHAGYEIAQSNAAWLLMRLDPRAHAQRALVLYSQAAKQGNAEAKVKLGDMYFYGIGAPTDYETAVDYYQAAHDHHHGRAAFNLAWCYQKGLGVKYQDFHLAKRHYGSAVDFYPAEATWPVRLAAFSLYFDWCKHLLRKRRGHYPMLLNAGFSDDRLLAALVTTLAILISLRIVRTTARRNVDPSPPISSDQPSS